MNEYLKKKLDRAREICKPFAARIERGLGDAKGKYAEVSSKFRRRYMDIKAGNRKTLDSLNVYFNERVDKFMVLVLYYSLLGKDVPLKDRAMVLAALGYFISPIDFIPDILGVMGFSDDFAVLMLVFRKIRDNVTPDVHIKAKARLAEWFGEDSLNKLKI